MAKIEPTSSAGAGDQTAVTLTCYAVGCCWAVDESDLTMTKKQMMDTPEGIVIKKTYSARSMVDPRNKKVLWHWPVMLPCIANRVQWWITGWKISVKYCEILLSRKKNSFFPLILYPICSMYGGEHWGCPGPNMGKWPWNQEQFCFSDLNIKHEAGYVSDKHRQQHWSRHDQIGFKVQNHIKPSIININKAYMSVQNAGFIYQQWG